MKIGKCGNVEMGFCATPVSSSMTCATNGERKKDSEVMQLRDQALNL
ncbi:MAG: hypothetical protein M1445_13975 [Bacteroidetes bacterium]|nr:hypothetical protein [Bacteroidota bacterium]